MEVEGIGLLNRNNCERIETLLVQDFLETHDDLWDEESNKLPEQSSFITPEPHSAPHVPNSSLQSSVDAV